MKKLLFFPLLLLAVTTVAACDDDDETKAQETTVAPDQSSDDTDSDEENGTITSEGNGQYLVLYASRTGNTESVAQFIQTTLDCDIQVVEPETAYDDDYSTMLQRAQDELAAIEQGNYPAIKTTVDSFDSYDIIFIGYPIWHGSMATTMQTFLYSHASKLSGKRIALFATSGSSSISTSVSEARNLCGEATIIDETLLLTSSTLSQMETRTAAWLEELGASRQEEASDTDDASSLKVNITVGSQTISATMEDNAAAQDFISRLPLEVTLNDYNNTTEKIFYPSPALTTDGVTYGCAPEPGDITIYEPWGNVAIFCKSGSYSDDLIKIGHIDDDGIELLTVDGDITVKFESAE